MRPEWQRRTIAIAIAATYAGLSRKFEGAYLAVDLNPVWITRLSAIAVLVVCFKLADMIPDHLWPNLSWRPRAVVYLLLFTVGLSMLLGLFLGEAH